MLRCDDAAGAAASFQRAFPQGIQATAGDEGGDCRSVAWLVKAPLPADDARIGSPLPRLLRNAVASWSDGGGADGGPKKVATSLCLALLLNATGREGCVRLGCVRPVSS